MEEAVSNKVIDVSQTILLLALSSEYIDDETIKNCCMSEAVSRNHVFNLVRPYLDDFDDKLFKSQNMRYRISNEGSKFVVSGTFERERLKRKIDELQKDNLEYEKRIRIWKFVSLILGIIIAVFSLLSSFKC